MRIGTICSNNPPGVATIGFFDGVHRGHCYLIGQVKQAAAARGLASTVITFPVHPRKVMQPAFSPALLTTCDEKLALLEATGLDICLMLNFTPELSRLSAKEFMEVLRNRYAIRALVIGYDHRFGHLRSEGFDDYVRYGRELSMEVLPADALPGGEVSSSAIRQQLHEGQVEQAARGLGYDYFLRGKVVSGRRVGRTLGFPTANLRVDDADKLVPADGVYAVRAEVDGRCYGGMLSIGCRPTLHNGTDRSIELHLFDFSGNLYDRLLTVSFVCRTRSERQFDSLEALAGQLRRDEQEIRALLAGR